MTRGPGDDARRETLREYREFIRTSHPDRGGDPEEFVAGLTRFRALLGEEGAADPPRDRGTIFSGTAAETTVYRRGSLPARIWRQLTSRHRRRGTPRVQ